MLQAVARAASVLADALALMERSYDVESLEAERADAMRAQRELLESIARAAPAP